MSVDRRRGGWRAAAGAAAMAVVSAGLWRAGRGPLALPGSRSWAGVCTWYAEVGPAVAVVAAVRGAALVTGLWLLAGCLLELAACLAGGRWARWVADLVAPRSLQRLVHGLAGLSLTAGLAVVAPSAGTPAGGGDGVAVLRVADEPPAPAGTASMRAVDAAPPAVPVPVPSGPAAGGAVPEVVVAAGDCFWSISAEVLAGALGRAPDDGEIAAYWRRFVAANRDRLVDPANADLLYPGQVLVVPAP